MYIWVTYSPLSYIFYCNSYLNYYESKRDKNILNHYMVQIQNIPNI